MDLLLSIGLIVVMAVALLELGAEPERSLTELRERAEWSERSAVREHPPKITGMPSSTQSAANSIALCRGIE